jgi:hypothetical protein
MVTHNGYATQGTEPTKIVLGLGQGGSLYQSLTIKVGDKYDIVEKLVTRTQQNTAVGIGGATIHLQMSGDQQTWSPLTDFTTKNEANIIGMFGVLNVQASSPYAVYLRAIYDGDSQYAPTVSNVVALTVTQ